VNDTRRRYWFAPFSKTSLRNDPARVHGLDQSLVVALILVGVGMREVGDGAVEGIAIAQVGRDGNPVA
jgi:hypothetical protein